MDSTPLVLVVLAAVALGALLPLAFQLTLTLRATRKMIASVEPRLNAAIGELSAAAAATNRSLSALDAAALQRTAEGVVEIGNLAKKARDISATIEMASAVGAAAAPAVAAIIKAWRAPAEAAPAESEEPSNQEPHNEQPVVLHRKEMDQS